MQSEKRTRILREIHRIFDGEAQGQGCNKRGYRHGLLAGIAIGAAAVLFLSQAAAFVEKNVVIQIASKETKLPTTFMPVSRSAQGAGVQDQ